VETVTETAGEIAPIESELIVEQTTADEMVFEQPPETSQEAGFQEELAGLAAVSALRDESAMPGFESEDEAMAWLESLAARQGALEEELLTKPDERPTETPEWIQQFAAESVEETETPGEQALPESAAALVEPAAIIAAGLVAEQVFEKEESVEEPVAGVLQPPELPSEEPLTEAEQVTNLDEGIELTTEEAFEAESEQPLDEELPVVAGAAVVGSFLAEEHPAEVMPTERLEPSIAGEVELPDWLRGLESEAAAPTPEIVAGTWAPPAEFSEPETVAALADESPRLDINAASLGQLERFPGVGFIVAQSIVAYREVNGPFTSLDQLQEIPGISPETIDELKRRLVVEMVSEAAPQPPSIPELAQAWQNIANGNISAAVEQYTIFIRGNRELPEVIAEIQEALLIYPLDPLLYQTLGDAYVRADRLQEAMEAYTHAEDLLK
jgi:competence protein ComEA